MTITKEELIDWNSNPVTKHVFAEAQKAVKEVTERSKIRDTIDQTVIQTARDEGIVEGFGYLQDAYDVEVEDMA